jgi:hypothetical protein
VLVLVVPMVVGLLVEQGEAHYSEVVEVAVADVLVLEALATVVLGVVIPQVMAVLVPMIAMSLVVVTVLVVLMRLLMALMVVCQVAAVVEEHTTVAQEMAEMEDAEKSGCGFTDEWNNTTKPSRRQWTGRPESTFSAHHIHFNRRMD